MGTAPHPTLEQAASTHEQPKPARRRLTLRSIGRSATNGPRATEQLLIRKQGRPRERRTTPTAFPLSRANCLNWPWPPPSTEAAGCHGAVQPVVYCPFQDLPDGSCRSRIPQCSRPFGPRGPDVVPTNSVSVLPPSRSRSRRSFRVMYLCCSASCATHSGMARVASIRATSAVCR